MSSKLSSKLSSNFNLRSVHGIVHATTPLSLRSILGIGRVLDQRSRRQLLASVNYSKSKLAAPRDITLSRIPRVSGLCEASGVYFRLAVDGKTLEDPLKPIKMLFSKDLLTQYANWTLNSVENNGFVFGPHGYCLTSAITGKRGITYFTHIDEDELENIDPEVAELVIPEDVNLLNLERVIVPVSVVREVDALGLLEPYKNLITLQS